MSRSIYRGFSTAFHRENGNLGFQTSNVETVKRDLLNHIWTIRGERVMQPSFGTSIPLLAFEPLDPATLKVVEDELREVVAYDPRVELIDIVVAALPDNNAIFAAVDIRYLELNVTETLKLSFPTGS